jgi:hypothetical protein
VTALSFNVRAKLDHLAEDTGGATYFVSKAVELEGVYGEIERELRSRYFLAYEAVTGPEGGDGPGEPEEGNVAEERFREVEVKMKPRGLAARTIRGYYP